MKCPNCNKEVSSEWTVCPFCRFEPKKCSKEGCQSGWLPDEAHFCPICGSPVAGEENLHLKKVIAEFVRQQSKMGSAAEDNCRKEAVSVKDVSFTMIMVEAGTFDMGDEEDTNAPIHKVTLTQDFFIGETQVTQALWMAVMQDNPSKEQGNDFPVTNVSWDDCQKFIRKLNQITHRQFRLPTEAEWEYAARGGNKSRGYQWSGCNSEDELEQYAWYDKNAYFCGVSNANFGTHPVRQKRPNELGLYDMSGNVLEWCEDLYSSSSSDRVYRGGSWSSRAEDCRVSYRRCNSPGSRFYILGFRLAL